MGKFEEKIQHFTKLQEEIVSLDRQLKEKMERYKAEVKATFGITDGEQMNVIELVKSMKKVKELLE